MHTLRTVSTFARLVLAGWLLALGVAGAAPLVHPQAMELVCSASGRMQLVLLDEDAQAVPAAHASLDCALCLSVATPPPPLQARVAPPQPLGRALQPVVRARIAALVGAPLPPRGPPQSLSRTA